jgi:hypothetical protein
LKRMVVKHMEGMNNCAVAQEFDIIEASTWQWTNMKVWLKATNPWKKKNYDAEQMLKFVFKNIQMGSPFHRTQLCMKAMRVGIIKILQQVFKASVEWTIRFKWWNGLFLHDRTPVTQKLLTTSVHQQHGNLKSKE